MNHRFQKFAFRYSVRNLQRNPRRSGLLIAAVALAVMTSVVARCYVEGVFDFWVASTTESDSGQAQVHRQGFWEEGSRIEERYLMRSGDPLDDLVRGDKEVAAVAQRLEVSGLVSAGSKAIYFLGIGMQASQERTVIPRLFSYAFDGAKDFDDERKNGVIVGKGLADTLGVSVGDGLSLTVHTLKGVLNAVDVNLIGIVDFPQSEMSKRLMYMDLKLAQRLMGVEGQFNEMALRLRDDASLSNWIGKVKPIISKSGGDVRPWWEIFPPMKRVQSLWEEVVGFVSMLLFLSAAVSVLNIIYLTVSERKTEIGVLMALGANSQSIRRMVMSEALLAGLFGGLAGLGSGLVIVLVMGWVGVPLPNPFFRGYVYIFPEVRIWFSLASALSAVLICYLVAWLPARKACSVDPVVVLRGDA